MNIWDSMLKVISDSVDDQPEPESNAQAKKLFNYLVKHYGTYISHLTDPLDQFLMAAVLAEDVNSVIRLNANNAFNAFLHLYAMIKVISPETIKLLDQRDPEKFDVMTMTWEE